MRKQTSVSYPRSAPIPNLQSYQVSAQPSSLPSVPPPVRKTRSSKLPILPKIPKMPQPTCPTSASDNSAGIGATHSPSNKTLRVPGSTQTSSFATFASPKNENRPSPRHGP